MWSLRLNLTQRGKTYQGRTKVGLTGLKFFHDFLVSGAWPFLVGGVICQVNSGNERDFGLLIDAFAVAKLCHLEGLCNFNARKLEAITGL